MLACGTAAVGDVGNSLAAVPAIGAAGLRGIFFHELVGSRDAREGGALADAGRELESFLAGPASGGAASDAGAATWPPGLAYVPAPHAPYSVGRELLRKIFHVVARAGVPTSVHVAEDRDEIRAPARRQRRLAGRAAAHGRRSGDARAWPAARRLSGVAGRVRRRATAAAGAHGPRRRRRPAPRARCRRHGRALPALQPAHHRRAARRRRAASPTESAWRSAPTAWRRHRTCPRGASWRR